MQLTQSLTRRTLVKGLAGSFAFPLNALSQGTSGSLVMVVGSPISNRFAVVEFSSAYVPSVVLVNAGFGGCQVAVSGSLAFVGSAVNGMVVAYDISSPSSPQMLGSVNTTLSGIGPIVANGSTVAVGEVYNSYAARVCLLSFAQPSSPVILGTAQTPLVSTAYKAADGTNAVSSLGFLTSRLLIASGQSDFEIVKINFATPSAPTISTFLPYLAYPPVLDVNSTLNMIVAGDNGDGIIKIFSGTSNQLIRSVATGLPSIDSIAVSDVAILAGSTRSPYAVKISLGDYSVAEFSPIPMDSESGTVVGISGHLGLSGSTLANHVSLSDLSSAPSVLAIADVTFTGIGTVALTTVTATVASPALTYSPGALNFGGTPLNVDDSLAVTLRNSGSAVLRILGIKFSGDTAFRVTNTVPSTLQPGASFTLSVAFRPTTTSVVHSALLLSTNDPRHPQVSIALSGSGVQPAPKVINGTFETGWLAPWTIFAPGPGFRVNVFAGEGHLGRYGLAQDGTTGLVYQDITGLTYGMRYVFTAWVRIQEGATATALLTAHDTNDGNYVQSAAITAASALSWIQVSISFRADSTLKARVHLVRLAGTGTVSWDDVYVWPSLFAG